MRKIIWLLLAVLMVGCRTITNEESYVERHKIDSLVQRMDSLISKSYVVQQDSAWRETIIKELQSIKEKSDTSHTIVLDTAGNVVKETIIINNTKEVTSERLQQEVVGMMHKMEKMDSVLSVQNEYISKMDSLLQESVKEKTIEKKLSWWQKLWQQGKGILVGVVISALVFLVLKFKNILKF